MKIVLDPGHGGRDPGAVDGVNLGEGDQLHTEEDDLTFTLALILQSMLSQDHEVLLTRRHVDQYLALAQRVAVANQAEADLYISLHMNAASNPEPNGVEVLYYSSGERLAELIQEQLVKSLGAFDRGIRQRKGLYVLRNTKMPAVLIELGFITNPEEERKLNDVQYLIKAARAIAQAVNLYVREGQTC